MPAPSFEPADLLPHDLLEGIRGRAAGYDRDNRFPDEDLAELRDAGYLSLFVPRERGGAGLGLTEVAALQQRLAEAAPATALAINMHLVWTGVAKVLGDRGIHDLDLVLDGAAEGEIFAFGLSEAGNDQILFSSDTRAEPLDDGGVRYTGTKIFTSLAPVWTRLGVHGLDTTSSDAPRIVFGFLTRSPEIVTRDDWDTLGMRATQSRTTELRGAVAPARHVVRRTPAEPHADPLVFAIFGVFEILLASVYAGIARRALDLAVDAADRDDPDTRRRVASMAIAYDAVPLQIASLARDVDELADHGARWFSLFAGLKHRAASAAKGIVDDALVIAGGASFRASSELSRLYRDVAAGVFHPSNPDSAHRTAAAAWLGPLSR